MFSVHSDTFRCEVHKFVCDFAHQRWAINKGRIMTAMLGLKGLNSTYVQQICSSMDSFNTFMHAKLQPRSCTQSTRDMHKIFKRAICFTFIHTQCTKQCMHNFCTSKSTGTRTQTFMACTTASGLFIENAAAALSRPGVVPPWRLLLACPGFNTKRHR